MTTMQRIIVTADNLEAAKEACIALDQRRELEPGCETWGITYAGGQRGQMTRWPNGRGAICRGGDSDWGDWDGDTLILDCGERVNDAGQTVHEYRLHVYDADDNCLSSGDECYPTEAEAEQAVQTARSRHPDAARIDVDLCRDGDDGRPRYEDVSAWELSDAEQRFVRIL
jgi:hypothetical protein